MAMNVVIPLLIPLEENILNSTRLLAGRPKIGVHFEHSEYCSILFEDEPLGTLVAKVQAAHSKEIPVHYSITGGNGDGLFTIDKSTGDIFLAAKLDRESKSKHELIVAARGDSLTAQSLVDILVADVNDNPPFIRSNQTKFTVVEEVDRGLPKVIARVEVEDKDLVDEDGLLYTLTGDGVDGYMLTDAFFSINPITGEVIQKRAVDREVPNGKPIWQLKVTVRDGFAKSPRITLLDTSQELSPKKTSKPKREVDIRHSHHHKIVARKFEGIIQNKLFWFEEKNQYIPLLSRHQKSRNSTNVHTNNLKYFHWFDAIGDARNIFFSDLKTYEVKNIINRKRNHSVNFSNLVRICKYLVSNNPTKILPKKLSLINKVMQRKIFNSKFATKGKTLFMRNCIRSFMKSSKTSLSNLQFLHRRNSKKIRISRNARYDKHSRENEELEVSLRSGRKEARINFEHKRCIRFGKRKSSENTMIHHYANSNHEENITRTNGRSHVTEIHLNIVVKDLNDNAPVFPNQTMYGEVQENGPIDLPVMKVQALDADDEESGTNALVTYSIEKNVVDDDTGEPLFAIDLHSGLLRTAVCCLDRETTPEYYLQVVAADGGGLKGTGTVVVILSDLNDNPPRLARREWEICIEETPADSTPNKDSILEITADDPDSSNYFLFRIVPGSGNGWKNFGLKTNKNVGSLFVASQLDYENTIHKQGLRFLVEVTDRGPGGWDDRSHIDSAWVSVKLKDINDNSPEFQQTVANITIAEDAPVGTLLSTFFAHDLDEGENGKVTYQLRDLSNNLFIAETGEVRLQSLMDREGFEGAFRTVKIIAIDKGNPARTSTATLYVNLKDINDSSPRLLLPSVLHVIENLPPMKIGEIFVTDDDVWSLGHGPPFRINISNQTSVFVSDRIDLRFQEGANLREAQVWTKMPLDREESSQMVLKVTLSDAQGVTKTTDVNIIVDDVNDNPMKPGVKTVLLWKTPIITPKAPLGRVFVDDPDDWDIVDKSYHWMDQPHPMFALNGATGQLFALGKVEEGRYELLFKVSDSLWGQENIEAKVNVIVRTLSSEAISQAVPLTISSTSALSLTHNWVPTERDGILGVLKSAVEESLSHILSEVQIVSVYDTNHQDRSNQQARSRDEMLSRSNYNGIRKVWTQSEIYIDALNNLHSAPSSVIQRKVNPRQNNFTNIPTNFDLIYSKSEMASTCIWISAKEKDGLYMEAVKLRGLLELNFAKIKRKLNHTIHIGDFAEVEIREKSFSSSSSSSTSSLEDSSNSSTTSASVSATATSGLSAASTLESLSALLQVVDANQTALVTPRLSSSIKCTSPSVPSTADCPFSCRNGGRCIFTERGPRCLCRDVTEGPFCTVVSRSFSKDSWIWLRPLPSCLPLRFSLRFLTRYPTGMLLYSGPLTDFSLFPDRHRHSPAILILQLLDRKPQLILRAQGMSINLEVEGRGLVDNAWHFIHVKITEEDATLMLDYCVARNEVQNGDFKHCFCNVRWPNSLSKHFGDSSSPIQLGGLASRPEMDFADSSQQIVTHSIIGCISELRILDELMDLGEPKYSHKTLPGCHIENNACRLHESECEGKGVCEGGLSSKAFCSCPTGWTGTQCQTLTKPVGFESNGFVKLALSFSPDPLHLSFHMRVKTKSKNGVIFKMRSKHNHGSFILKVVNGMPCLLYTTRLAQQKKKVTVSIVGITSTSSFKTLNLSNSVYIKDWSQNNLIDDLSNDKLNRAEAGNKNTIDELKFSTVETCISQRMISDGTWYTIKGARYGTNLVLELINKYVSLRNETLKLWDIYKKLLKKKQRKFPKEILRSNEFVVDILNGLTLGNGFNHDFTDILHNKSTTINLTTCIDDFRISGHAVALLPNDTETRWARVSAFRGAQQGCGQNAQCEMYSCPQGLICKEDWGEPSCECSPHHRPSQHGCQPFEVCVLNPCFNGGICEKNDAGFTCLCLPHFEGDYCQWRSKTMEDNGAFGSIIITSLFAALVCIVTIVIIAYHQFRKRKQTRRKRKTGVDLPWSSGAKSSTDFTTISLHQDPLTQKVIGGNQESNSKNKHPPEQGEEKIKKEKSKLKISIQDDPPLSAQENFAVFLPKDDLRAYAYEGEGGSSEGSLGSAISDLRRKISCEIEEAKHFPPTVGEVMDLLKNLPDASLHHKKSSAATVHPSGCELESRTNLPHDSLPQEDSENVNQTATSHRKMSADILPTTPHTTGKHMSSEGSVSISIERKKHCFVRESSSSSFWYTERRVNESGPPFGGENHESKHSGHNLTTEIYLEMHREEKAKFPQTVKTVEPKGEGNDGNKQS